MKIKTLKISHFRGLHGLELADLPLLSIITGDNSAGKTAILEALYLMFGLNAQTFAHFPYKFRSQMDQADAYDNFWMWLFPKKDPKNAINLTTELENGTQCSLLGGIDPKAPEQLKFWYLGAEQKIQGESFVNKTGGSGSTHSTRNWPKAISPDLDKINHANDASRYNSVVLTYGGEDRVLALMKALDQRITRIRYLKITKTPLVYVDLGLQTFVPMSQMGAAFSRVFSLYLTMIFDKPDIVILDEIENGIHLEKMSTVWRGIAAIAKSENIQIITTTHSRECLKAAFEAVGDNEEISTKRYTLKLDNNAVTLTTAESFLEDGQNF